MDLSIESHQSTSRKTRRILTGESQDMKSENTQIVSEGFESRHIGPRANDIEKMLQVLECKSLSELTDKIVPDSIRLKKSLHLPKAESEYQAVNKLKEISKKNKVFKNYIGMGYSETLTPSVIARNVLENPGWYTQYTPYQSEIAQGRLEALINFQTMISDLTGLDLSNSSLLDEATAAAEAMSMAYNIHRGKRSKFLVASDLHPQIIEVLVTRAEPLNIEVIVNSTDQFNEDENIFGCLFSYPTTFGDVKDYSSIIETMKIKKIIVIFAADLLALTYLKSPGELGVDIAIGSTQRFGVPLGFGGPHAAYISTRNEFKRLVPGRIVGVSKDKDGNKAYRLALQTREQHIRREKATSNICTAQVLLAIMASFYGVYHGPQGLKKIAKKIHDLTLNLAEALSQLGFKTQESFFDTLKIYTGSQTKNIYSRALESGINLRWIDNENLGVSIGESISEVDLISLLKVFSPTSPVALATKNLDSKIPKSLVRTSSFMTHPVFNSFHSETELMRYIFKLQNRDLSLAYSMIPLGSCTMKLNAASEMLPVSWPEFSALHPFAPTEQTVGYREMISQLENWLCEITGFSAISFQPNAGSQGEYAGLLVIRKFHQSRGESHRNICLIPTSAHGTNPASSAMAGMKVIPVQCDEEGNIDINDLKQKSAEHAPNLGALMVTYPSTHGVFEEGIREICSVVHQNGGLVYMDGANLNAQLGLCRPADMGADVCHLNLHKTFCIPHGGGGPGMGPIGVTKELESYLPEHKTSKFNDDQRVGAISAAAYGSPSILPISWMYIAMMGEQGMLHSSQIAILNANYIANRLSQNFKVLYKGRKGMVAHECIIDLRPVEARTGITVEDIAKRLMDYGFHAPTVSWPVPGTMMIEPTESESLNEIERFCDAMISISKEIKKVENGTWPKDENPLKNAPHTAQQVASSEWNRPYSREQGCYPTQWVRENKFWPVVSRIDNPFGDRNLFCTCPPVEEKTTP